MRAAFSSIVLGLGAVMLATLAAAAPQKKLGERIAITGCPYVVAAATCLMLNDVDGTVYNISSVRPWPRPIDRMIWLRGTVSARPGLCGQGVVLEGIRWTRLRQRCLN